MGELFFFFFFSGQMGRKDNGSRGVLGRRYFFWAGYKVARRVRELFGGYREESLFVAGYRGACLAT